jgi:hypothetical protein
MANTVTLTLAGEPRPAVDAFNRVASAGEDMGRRVSDAGDSFDRTSERADTLDTRAMGFRDTLTGIQDGTEGIKRAAAGDWGFETLLLLGTGVGDLASAFVNFLIPAIKGGTTAIRAMSLAMLTSPITWIILGITALVVVIVLIATKTDWFSRAWNASWRWIRESASNAWNFIRRIPDWIGNAFSRIANYITRPFRAAFNGVSDAWNYTIGRLSWTVPSWVPGIGGASIGAPRLPRFHTGGIVPGRPGQEVPIMAMAGERVSPPGSNAGGQTVYVRGDGIIDALIDLIAQHVRHSGGDARIVLGGANV